MVYFAKIPEYVPKYVGSVHFIKGTSVLRIIGWGSHMCQNMHNYLANKSKTYKRCQNVSISGHENNARKRKYKLRAFGHIALRKFLRVVKLML